MIRREDLQGMIDQLWEKIEEQRQENIALKVELGEVRHELMVARLNERQARHSAMAAKRAFQRAWDRCVYEDRTGAPKDVN